MRTAILPGTYDPITCGHTSLAVRAAALFGRAVVVVMNNTEKRTLFSFDQRSSWRAPRFRTGRI